MNVSLNINLTIKLNDSFFFSDFLPSPNSELPCAVLLSESCCVQWVVDELTPSRSHQLWDALGAPRDPPLRARQSVDQYAGDGRELHGVPDELIDLLVGELPKGSLPGHGEAEGHLAIDARDPHRLKSSPPSRQASRRPRTIAPRNV